MAQEAPTKTVEFEGTTHQFPTDFSDADISKALASFGQSKTAKPSPSALPPPPEPESSPVADNWKKLGRGAALGAASGAGIPESTSGVDVVTGAIGNAADGLYDAGKAILKDPVEGTAKVLHNMASNIEKSGGEAWQGYKNRDPEMFAHGLASTVTQLLTLKAPEKGASVAANDLRLARTTTAIRAGGEEAAAVRKTIPDIAAQAGAAGLSTVGEFTEAVKQAKDTIDQEFNQHLAPIANKPYIPIEISRRIKNLITPDMAKTAEGRMQIKEITARAREYEKPWTLNELNAKRVTENNNLKSYFSKDTRGQAASKLDMDISKSVRDGAADVVYDQMSQNNPKMPTDYFSDLKSKQGSLWALADHLGDASKGTGVIGDILAEQLKHEGTSPMNRIKLHAYGSGSGFHGYLSGIQDAFSGGPQAAADAGIKKAFPDASVKTIAKTAGKDAVRTARRATWKSLPIWHLMSPPEAPVRNTPFPGPPATSDEQ